MHKAAALELISVCQAANNSDMQRPSLSSQANHFHRQANHGSWGRYRHTTHVDVSHCLECIHKVGRAFFLGVSSFCEHTCRQMEAITDRCEWHGQLDYG